MTDETLLDIGDLDDMTLDDVEDAAEFMCPPSGKYLLGIKESSIQNKEKDGVATQAVRIIYFVKETQELNNQEDDLVPAGTLFSENFQGNKIGMGFFKTRMKKLFGDEIQGLKIADMCDFLPKQFGEEGDKDILTVLKKVISNKDGNEYENVRFQKMEAIDRG